MDISNTSRWIYPTRVAGYIQHVGLEAAVAKAKRDYEAEEKPRYERAVAFSLAPRVNFDAERGGQHSARFRTSDVPVVKFFLAGIDDG